MCSLISGHFHFNSVRLIEPDKNVFIIWNINNNNHKTIVVHSRSESNSGPSRLDSFLNADYDKSADYYYKPADVESDEDAYLSGPDTVQKTLADTFFDKYGNRIYGDRVSSQLEKLFRYVIKMIIYCMGDTGGPGPEIFVLQSDEGSFTLKHESHLSGHEIVCWRLNKSTVT